MKRALFLVLCVALVGVAYVVWAPARTDAAAPAVDLGSLPAATVTSDPRRGELTIELAPVDLPTASGGGDEHGGAAPPASLAVIPVSGAIFGFRTELVDATGRVLPPGLLHHFNLMDPTSRELFLPIGRRVAAAGKETGTVRLPWMLFGAPFAEGDRIVANAMLHNPTSESYRGVRARIVLYYTPPRRPWPLFRAYPWQLDVAFPVGDKSFDIPPGVSERSYEGSPAVPGDVVAIGGHLHEYGVSIELANATTGEVIWRAETPADKRDQAIALPIGKLWRLTRLGVRIVPTERYRVRVVYDNPTGRVIRNGGMGVVAGLFVPDGDVQWPAVDPADSLYQRDLRHFLGRSAGLVASPAAGHSVHTHH